MFQFSFRSSELLPPNSIQYRSQNAPCFGCALRFNFAGSANQNKIPSLNIHTNSPSAKINYSNLKCVKFQSIHQQDNSPKEA